MNRLLVILLLFAFSPDLRTAEGAADESRRLQAVEDRLRDIMQDDDRALADVDRWIKENSQLRVAGGGLSNAELHEKILSRMETVEAQYRAFLEEHPRHAEARTIYGAFLEANAREEEAMVQWNLSRLIDPTIAATWNNMANYHGHRGGVTNSFYYYSRAIALNPEEPVYFQNLGTTVYLFRTDAKSYYGIEEPEVFDRALALYQRAITLKPDDLALATDYAQSYYGIRPFRYEDARAGWEYALALAADELQRQAIHIHLARVAINGGKFDEARSWLAKVNLPEQAALKQRMERRIAEEEPDAGGSTTSEPGSEGPSPLDELP